MVESNQDRAALAQSLFVPNYKPAPLVIERGEGSYVFDVEGRRYLDMAAGVAVSALGHGHPALVAAIQAQAAKVLHTSNLYLNRPSIELARRLSTSSFGGRIFFCNSGAEANEAQIKLARRTAWDRGDKKRVRILSFLQSFHGRTFGALAATGQAKYHEGFAPMPEGFVHLPFGDVEALEKAVDDTVAAVIVECVQGEGGVRVAPPGFIALCRKLTQERGALLLLDEVQIGVGRSGKMWGYEHEGITPDIMATAKGIGGGLPLGAIVAKDEIAQHLTPGTHGTTYGGNPVACAAGLAVFDVIEQPSFLESVRARGDELAAGLRAIGKKHGVFTDVRGRGLLLGAEMTSGLKFDAKAVVDACRAQGMLAHIAGPNVLRLAPPLVVQPAEVQSALEILDRALSGLVSQS